MNKISFKDISFANKHFWNGYFEISYSNSYDEESDMSVTDLFEENELSDEEDFEYWDKLTGYYDGVLEESDGYLDNPTYLEEPFGEKTLKIELHPGDVLYYLDGEEIGCTGPHWKLNVIPFDEIKPLLDDNDENKEIFFWLLLPLASANEDDRNDIVDFLQEKLTRFFDSDVSGDMAKLIVSQIIPEE